MTYTDDYKMSRPAPTAADVHHASSAKRIGEPTFSTALEDLDPVIARAAQYAERLHHLADRIQGPQPEKHPGELQAPEGASFLLAALNARRSRLVDILNVLEHAVNRLEGSI